MKRYGLEDALFTWQEWDENGVMSPMFYDVVLKVPVGDFPTGHKFPVAFLNGEDSTITFMEDKMGEKSHTFELSLSVGKPLTEADMREDEHACTCGASHD